MCVTVPETVDVVTLAWCVRNFERPKSAIFKKSYLLHADMLYHLSKNPNQIVASTKYHCLDGKQYWSDDLLYYQWLSNKAEVIQIYLAIVLVFVKSKYLHNKSLIHKEITKLDITMKYWLRQRRDI